MLLAETLYWSYERGAVRGGTAAAAGVCGAAEIAICAPRTRDAHRFYRSSCHIRAHRYRRCGHSACIRRSDLREWFTRVSAQECHLLGDTSEYVRFPLMLCICSHITASSYCYRGPPLAAFHTKAAGDSRSSSFLWSLPSSAFCPRSFSPR